jgi:hypothetical protein
VSNASSLFEAARQASRDGRDLDARLALAAGIALLAAPNLRPIVVGGTAVDFYAAQATPEGGLRLNRDLRASQDVDIITVSEFGSDPVRLRNILAASPEFYSEEGKIPVEQRRKWWLKGAPILVEILRGELYGDPGRVIELEVEGAPAYIWAPEDTAWQYAQTALATKDRACWERALVIAAVQSNQAWDWDYLQTRADDLAPVELVASLRAGDSYDEMLVRMRAT